MIDLTTLHFLTEDKKQLTITMQAKTSGVAKQPNIGFSVALVPPGSTFELSFNDASQLAGIINVLLNEE